MFSRRIWFSAYLSRFHVLLIIHSILIAVLIVLADTSFPGVPPSDATNVLSLDGYWRFVTDSTNQGERSLWYSSSFDDSGWAMVATPHSWNTLPELETYRGVAWYRKTFVIPPSFDDLSLRLVFETTGHISKVWLNDVELGRHEGAYTSYSFDITDVAISGAENVLAVRLDNTLRSDTLPAKNNKRNKDYYDWWYWGGITGSAKIYATNRTFISKVNVSATPDLVGSAVIDVAATVKNIAAFSFVGSLEFIVREGERSRPSASSVSQTFTIKSGQNATIRLAFQIFNPKLWHFDNPNLYVFETKLKDRSGKYIHSMKTTFGIRKIEVKDCRLYLNGEWVRLAGIARHADVPGYGPIERYDIISRDFDDIKEANAVLSRLAHYPQHSTVLDYCDRNGILLISEIPVWHLSEKQMTNPKIKTLAKQMLREMVERDFNHPCIWAWSLGDGILADKKGGVEFITELYNYAKSLDSHRYVSFASAQAIGGKDARTICDFIMWDEFFSTGDRKAIKLKEVFDYFNLTLRGSSRLGAALDNLHRKWPDKMVLVSEWGGFNNGSLSAENKIAKIMRIQASEMRSRFYVGGVIFWLYNRYKTPIAWSGGYDTDTKYALAGLVDRDRKHLRTYDLVRKQFSPLTIKAISHKVKGLAPGDLITTTVLVVCNSPVTKNLPSYSLSGYKMAWGLFDSQGKILHEEIVPLSTLKPGYFSKSDNSRAKLDIVWNIPSSRGRNAIESGKTMRKYQLGLQAIRPTGFDCGISSLIPFVFNAGGGAAEPVLQNAESKELILELQSLFNNDGISDEGNRKDGNFDGRGRRFGSSFPADNLPESRSFFQPRKLSNVTFLFPDKTAQANNVACKGQEVILPSGFYKWLYVLGTAENGDQESILTIVYDDGTDEVPLRFSDWCQKAKFGEVEAIHSDHRHGWDGKEEKEKPCSIWVQKIELNSNRRASSIILPQKDNIHVFAMTLE